MSIILLFISVYIIFRKYFLSNQKNPKNHDIFSLMENTPVIHIKSLSKLTGYNIYAKCEYFSYYTSKDRIIKRILLDAKNKGKINKNTMIYEASNGLSAYSVVSICQLLGYNNITLVIPDSCPENIIKRLKKSKCKLIITKNVDFSNFSENYIRLCKKISSQEENSFYINMHQNELNLITNFEEIAPEFYYQLNNKIDAFVCCANTGGTISGFSNYLKLKNNKCFIALADIEKSAMNSYIKEGVLFRQENKEENKNINANYGTGNCFLNNNLRKAKIDECYLCKEEEILFMIDYIKKNDGINIGFNEGLNLVGILKMIKDKKDILPKNGNICTMFFDDGTYECDSVKDYKNENNNIKNINDIFK
jgi:cysteine synthase A